MPRDTNPHPEPVLLKVPDAAPLASMSRAAMYRAVAAGYIPSVRIGGALRVRRSDLENFGR